MVFNPGACTRYQNQNFRVLIFLSQIGAGHLQFPVISLMLERQLIYFCRCEKRTIEIMKQYPLDHNVHTNRKQFLYLWGFQCIFIISFIHCRKGLSPRPDPGHQEVAMFMENSTVIFTCRHLVTMNIKCACACIFYTVWSSWCYCWEHLFWLSLAYNLHPIHLPAASLGRWK